MCVDPYGCTEENVLQDESHEEIFFHQWKCRQWLLSLVMCLLLSTTIKCEYFCSDGYWALEFSTRKCRDTKPCLCECVYCTESWRCRVILCWVNMVHVYGVLKTALNVSSLSIQTCSSANIMQCPILYITVFRIRWIYTHTHTHTYIVTFTHQT
jgi:hypothetical protein